MMKMNYEILAFDDNADGEAYLTDIEYSMGIKNALFVAYQLAARYDHVCITHADTFATDAPLTFRETAPYSIITEIGIRHEL